MLSTTLALATLCWKASPQDAEAPPVVSSSAHFDSGRCYPQDGVDQVTLSAPAPQVPTGLPRIALLVALCASLGACASLPGGPIVARQTGEPITRQNLAAELPGGDRCGRLVPLSRQQADRPTHVTVHGMNGAPVNLQALTDQAAAQDYNTMAFVYEDRQCTLRETARDLASELADWRQAHPTRPLRIDAHCMGARISLKALSEMGVRAGAVQLNMLTPPLGGFALANTAQLVPRPLARLFPGTLPGYDMGSSSDFQAELERTTLPGNIKTRIFYGQRDELIDYTRPVFHQVQQNLRASVHYVPDADHMQVIDEVARGNFTARPLPYQPPGSFQAMVSF